MKRYWDDVVVSDPVNSVASRVVSKGFQYSVVLNDHSTRCDSDTPIALSNCDRQELSGMRFGRLTVIGRAKHRRHASGGTKGKARWVCKCSCGAYVSRCAKAIKNPKNTLDACDACSKMMWARRSEFWRRTGRDPADSFFD